MQLQAVHRLLPRHKQICDLGCSGTTVQNSLSEFWRIQAALGSAWEGRHLLPPHHQHRRRQSPLQVLRSTLKLMER